MQSQQSCRCAAVPSGGSAHKLQRALVNPDRLSWGRHLTAVVSASVCCVVIISQVDEVKGIMMQNVEQVLVRGERLDVLVDRTDDLRDQVGC